VIAAVMQRLVAEGYRVQAFDIMSSGAARSLHDIAMRYPLGYKVRMMLHWTF